MDDMSSREVVKSLLASVGLPLRLVEAAKLPESSRPVLPSSFRIGTAAQVSTLHFTLGLLIAQTS
jgi:hypothetical protein